MANNYYENAQTPETPTENTPRVKVTPDVPPINTQENPQPQEAPQRTEPIEIPEPMDMQNTETQNDNNNEPSAPDTSTASLVVSVFTANQLYPVVGATVSVSAENGENSDILDSSDTDRSGRTKTFTLPAPSASMSQEPTVAIPFAEYTVTVKAPNFFDTVIENVQLFGGILTQLPVNMIPLPELSNGETTKIVIIPRQNL